MKIELVTFRCSACNHWQQRPVVRKQLTCFLCGYVCVWDGKKDYVPKPFAKQPNKYKAWFKKTQQA